MSRQPHLFIVPVNIKLKHLYHKEKLTPVQNAQIIPPLLPPILQPIQKKVTPRAQTHDLLTAQMRNTTKKPNPSSIQKETR